MTDEELQAIRAREQVATVGPWAWESVAEKSNDWVVGTAWDAQGKPISGRIVDGEWIEDTVIRKMPIGENESDGARIADAEFIAHARKDIPALLAEVDRLKAELNRLTTCDCDRPLSAPRCNVCDNDE